MNTVEPNLDFNLEDNLEPNLEEMCCSLSNDMEGTFSYLNDLKDSPF